MARWEFLDNEGPLAFAHRGGASHAPENSMDAFRSAVQMGYRYLETDVHVTADGALVAFHDEVLDRVTDRTGVVASLSFAEVKAAKIGGEAEIPLLSDLLEEFPDVRVNLDPKHDAAVEPLVALIDAMGAIGRVCVGSFSDRRVRRAAAALGPELCTGMGPRSVARLRAASMGLPSGAIGPVCAQVPARVGGVALVTQRFVDAAHHRGKVVHVWVVDDRHEIERLLDLGVDGIMTDRPDVLRDVLIERGSW